MKKIAVVLMVLVLLVVFSGCAKKGEVIKIGVAAAMTGPQSAIGQDVINAVQIAVDEANEKGDIGKKLVLVAFDDKSEPKEAANIANKFCEDPDIVGVVGHLVSNCSIPASDVYNKAGLVMISPSSTNPKLTEQGFKNVFRTCATDDVQGSAAGIYVADKLKKKRIAILHDKGAYGQGLAEEFEKAVKAKKCTILIKEGITPNEMDYSAVLTKVKDKKPEVIYFGGMYPEGILIAKQLAVLNVKAVFMSGDGLYNPEYIKLADKAAEGTIISFLAPPFDQIDAAKDFVKKFTVRYKEIQTYAPYAYDAANIVIDSIRKAPKDKKYDRKIISEQAAKTDLAGITGRLKFDSKGDIAGQKMYFYKVEHGKFVWIK